MKTGERCSNALFAAQESFSPIKIVFSFSSEICLGWASWLKSIAGRSTRQRKNVKRQTSAWLKFWLEDWPCVESMAPGLISIE